MTSHFRRLAGAPGWANATCIGCWILEDLESSEPFVLAVSTAVIGIGSCTTVWRLGLEGRVGIGSRSGLEVEGACVLFQLK